MSVQVTVIIPAYNAESTICETIQSVLTQDYPAEQVEIIVIDDGSTDGTNSVVEKFGDKVIHIKQKNAGVSAARNNAATLARGKWLAFIDSDDIWTNNKLSLQISSIGDCLWSHTDSYYFGYKQTGETKRSDYTKQYDGNVFDKLILDNFITTSTVIVDREIFLKVGGFDENMKALEDWKLWLELSLLTPLHYCASSLAHYRVTPGSASRNAKAILPLHIYLIEHVFQKYQLNEKLKSKALSQSYSICSYIAEDGRDIAYSVYCAAKAFALHTTIAKLKRLVRCILNLFVKQ